MAIRIVLTGGGTGGHLFPLVQVAKEIRIQNKKTKFLFLGPNGRMEKEIMSQAGIQCKRVTSGKLYRYFTWRYFSVLFKLFWGIIQSLYYLLWYMPDVVFSKGGYASVPVVVVARIYRIPVLLHDSDAKAGLANRFLGSIVSKIAITFERAKIHFPVNKTIVTGNPINPDAIGGDKEIGRKILGMTKEVKPVVLILGGSQGAQIINQRIMSILKELVKRYQVIHQTGVNNFKRIKQEGERQGYKFGHSDYYPLPFIGEELKHFFALADVVISRSGSSAIAEIAANRKPSILIPLATSANNHQQINAFEVARVNGAIVLEEGNLRKTLLLKSIKKIIENNEFREKLVKNIANFYQPDAAQRIAQEILVLAVK